jgi:hypothetical protein
VFSLSAFFGESPQGLGHGLCQVDGGLEALAFNNLPLQKKTMYRAAFAPA